MKFLAEKMGQKAVARSGVKPADAASYLSFRTEAQSSRF
jgi:hypothetical protein